MDIILVKTVMNFILFGTAKASFLQMKDGTKFQNPEITSLPDNKKFGVRDPDNEDETFILLISDIEIIY